VRAEQESRSGSEELLLRVAWFYYKDELTQDEIAKRLSVSRASVGRMLDRARKVGLVTINLNADHLDAFEVSRQLRRTFGLTEALVVPDHAEGEGSRSALNARRRSLRQGGSLIGLGGEFQRDVPQRDGHRGLPPGRGEQRGPGHPAVGGVVPGRVARQLVPVRPEEGAHPQPVLLAAGQRSGSRHQGTAMWSSAQKLISSSSVRDCGATPARRVRPVARLQLVMSTRASNSSSLAWRTARLKNLRLVFVSESLA